MSEKQLSAVREAIHEDWQKRQAENQLINEQQKQLKRQQQSKAQQSKQSHSQTKRRGRTH
jgi:hypothetical protein